MKFALIGCGLIGRKRIESLIQLKQEIVGIYDLDKEILSEFSKNYNLRQYDSIESLLNI